MRSMRRGMTVAKIGVDEHGREFTDSIKEHKTINAAKRDNGLNARKSIGNEAFPPKKSDLPKIEEPEAVPA